jgi:hypothetical protein
MRIAENDHEFIVTTGLEFSILMPPEKAGIRKEKLRNYDHCFENINYRYCKYYTWHSILYTLYCRYCIYCILHLRTLNLHQVQLV